LVERWRSGVKVSGAARTPARVFAFVSAIIRNATDAAVLGTDIDKPV
jgi:hypothetical protein